MQVKRIYNGADALCSTLLANGIDVCFTNPGTSEMHFVAALDREEDMRCVLGTFEGVVTGAADGYARMAGKPAATLLHLGPGLANGLANLHNARRAGTPIVNVVGDHATYHLPYDAPLTSDIESLARPMSAAVRRVRDAGDVSLATAEAIEASRQNGGQIATLILPADAAWDPAPETIHRAATPTPTVNMEAVQLVAKALRNGKRSLIVAGGKALMDDELKLCSSISHATGARLLAEGAITRMERGQGRVKTDRIPYAVDLALEKLAEVEQLILVDSTAPVAFFAYPEKPSRLTAPDCEILSLARPGDDIAGALAALSDALGAKAAAPTLATLVDRPELPKEGFDASTIMRAVATLLPEGAIVCDEAITAGRLNFALMAGSAQHDYLQLTGGAIGIGIPMATGAAVASPDRKVVALQADGSGMYTMQGLWTQARENLDVLTIIFANRKYAILYNELRMMGVETPGHNARRMLDLDSPAFDWVSMGKAAGVESARADNLATFIDLFRAGLSKRGPFLIEAWL
ncbi:acetolactate synthase large subunit [Pseudorhodoferax soli]|uniref:Acetolactate synthase-1/2/3 large subunit n=1 Tax=Pseudorhodoferax soli TaxID=545864 RepID=A0A368XRJ7_9BURK|nr:acetolactate synthase large subunit [Pseudorhodoferax soli]RCW68634.1 acetolactate synthase-1/2/3 large subunit [Pseudorhodoferax soli]